MPDTNQTTPRTAAATVAAAVKRSLGKQQRMARELVAAGWQVAAPESGYVVTPAAAPTDYDGRQELCRELIARFPQDDVIQATHAEIEGCRMRQEEFDWEYVLDNLLNARNIKGTR